MSLPRDRLHYIGRRKEIEGLRLKGKVEFLSRQLSEFYWPIYLRLEKDNTIWHRILDKREDKESLLQKVGSEIEKMVVLPNHDEIVSIIGRSIHLAQSDETLKNLLVQYVRHVAVYKAIRSVGEETLFPINLGEEWPHNLFPEIEKRTMALQREYEKLLGVVRAVPDQMLERTV